MAWCVFMRFCWGLISRNQKITKMSKSGAKDMNAPAPEDAAPAWA
jgi:hypothetical protein